jgi:hypothetical protein
MGGFHCKTTHQYNATWHRQKAKSNSGQENPDRCIFCFLANLVAGKAQISNRNANVVCFEIPREPIQNVTTRNS